MCLFASKRGRFLLALLHRTWLNALVFFGVVPMIEGLTYTARPSGHLGYPRSLRCSAPTTLRLVPGEIGAASTGRPAPVRLAQTSCLRLPNFALRSSSVVTGAPQSCSPGITCALKAMPWQRLPMGWEQARTVPACYARY